MKKSIAGRQRGFTLLELMLTIGIAALIMGLAVPSFTNLIRNSRMTQAANDVMVALHMARSEAIKRRQPVAVCTATDLDDTPACITAATATGLRGWIVFVDSDRSGQWNDDSFNDDDGDGRQDDAEVDGPDADLVWTALQTDEDIDLDSNQDIDEEDIPAEIILQVHEPLPGTIFSRGSFTPLRITYADTGGTLDGVAGAIVLCDSRGNEAAAGELSSARAIVLSPTGRASVTRAPDEIDDQLARIATLTGSSTAIGGCRP